MLIIYTDIITSVRSVLSLVLTGRFWPKRFWLNIKDTNKEYVTSRPIQYLSTINKYVKNHLDRSFQKITLFFLDIIKNCLKLKSIQLDSIKYRKYNLRGFKSNLFESQFLLILLVINIINIIYNIINNW